MRTGIDSKLGDLLPSTHLATLSILVVFRGFPGSRKFLSPGINSVFALTLKIHILEINKF